MSKRKMGVVAALATAAFAVAPAPSHADIGDTCDGLIGSTAGNVNLSPLVNVGYKTCKEANTRG